MATTKEATQTNQTEPEQGQTNQQPQEGTAEWYQQKVQVELFKDEDKYKDDVYVGVNGKGYLIRRGEPVLVPRFVALILEQSKRQDAMCARMVEDLVDETAAREAELGIG